MVIHSFEEVIRAPKSIHSIPLTPAGHFRIKLWRPVSWISFIYFCALVLVFAIAAKVPVLDIPSKTFASLVYYIGFPAGIVWLVFYTALDGLAPHAWLITYLTYLRRSKRVLAGRVVAPDGTEVVYGGRVKIWWDLNAPRLHHGWVTGGRIKTSVPVRFTHAIRHRRQVVAYDKRGALADHEVQGKLQVRP